MTLKIHGNFESRLMFSNYFRKYWSFTQSYETDNTWNFIGWFYSNNHCFSKNTLIEIKPMYVLMRNWCLVLKLSLKIFDFHSKVWKCQNLIFFPKVQLQKMLARVLSNNTENSCILQREPDAWFLNYFKKYLKSTWKVRRVRILNFFSWFCSKYN